MTPEIAYSCIHNLAGFRAARDAWLLVTDMPLDLISIHGTYDVAHAIAIKKRAVTLLATHGLAIAQQIAARSESSLCISRKEGKRNDRD